MTGTRYTLEIQPRIPENLARLKDLANDLYYSWDRYSRGLFYILDRELWENVRHNPKVFLRRVSQERLEQAAADRTFLGEYHRTLDNYDTYLKEVRHTHFGGKLNPEKELVAYFCAEFGLHESLPIYSGGLGILAGDYCKSASDLGLPFVAMGILYRHGNFIQTIDDHGNQIIHQIPVALEDLLISPASTPGGRDVLVSVPLPGSEVHVKVWKARAGRTILYLLDTDIAENSPQNRGITSDLYPDDLHVRLKQEIILGIGGVRALNQLGLEPSIWHINEGYPCLLLIERWCNLIKSGMDFYSAKTLAAANTVFTTHTPITAGHEVYHHGFIREYLSPFIGKLGIDEKQFLELGQNEHKENFDFTSFSLRCSGFSNGVSKVHRDVAAEMERHVWPDIPVEENPMAGVTNGIHAPTFLAREWHELFNDPGWQGEMLNEGYWERIDQISDNRYWSVHVNLKADFIRECYKSIRQRCIRHGQGQRQVDCHTETLRRHNDVMLIGFARRFATYKRADLLFEHPERLKRILGNPDRPVVFLFAGKAHPNDENGKRLIHKIHNLSLQPEFIGKIILLEGYDMSLARKLVSGVDLWLNTPEFPMEACGTSGMKAAINGVVNFSVLDGWWVEGYNGTNGWAVQPRAAQSSQLQRQLESADLLESLEEEIIPMYFDKVEGCSPRWVRISKESMKSILPRFNSHRMISDYIHKLYLPALTVSEKLKAENGAGAVELSGWKRKIAKLWPGVTLKRVDRAPAGIRDGDTLNIRVAAGLNGLDRDDLIVECLLGYPSPEGGFSSVSCYQLKGDRVEENREGIYEISMKPDMTGLVAYKIRAYPYHPHLCHPLEMGLMKWI